MPTWPASLPQRVLVEGYGEEPPGGVLRSEVDSGQAKTRPRSTAEPRDIQVNLAMSEAQVDTVDAFYLNDLARGALSFDWVNPRTQVTARLRLVRRPRYVPRGRNRFTVQLVLEILP